VVKRTPIPAGQDLAPHTEEANRPLRRLWTWARPYRRDLVTMIITDVLALAAQMSVPLLVAAMIDGPIQKRDVEGILAYGAGMIGLGIVQTVMYVFRRRAMVAGLNIEHDLRVACYAHIQRLEPAAHDRMGSGQLIARSTGDLEEVRSFVAFTVPYLISTTFTLGFVIVMLLRLHLLLGILVLVAMVPMIVVSRGFRFRFERLAITAGRRTDDLAAAAEESALGIRVIKSYGRRPMMHERFTALAARLSDAELAKMRLFAGFDSLLIGYPILVLAAVVIGGVVSASTGALTLGEFVAFTAFYFRLLAPVTVAGALLAATQGAATSLVRVFEVLDSTPKLADPPRPAVVPTGRPLPVRFDRVGFTFAGARTAALRTLDLAIEPGETMALVGATGSGKSAMAALVGRLADVSEGRVLVGGIDVRDLRIADLRAEVGVAFEDATLFSLTVRDNLTLGRTGITDAEIERVIKITNAEFAYRLPQALDTQIGEQGLSLSGGQRQRLALARALLGRPRVLVLDDPMSAIDVRTEEAIESRLYDAFDGVTVLIIARRLSTALLADRVAVLADGRIADIGTHAELMARCATYRWLMIGAGSPEVGARV